MCIVCIECHTDVLSKLSIHTLCIYLASLLLLMEAIPYIILFVPLLVIHAFIHLSNHPSIYASIDLSVPPSIHLSNHPSIYASIDLSVPPSIHLSNHPSIYASIDLSVPPSIHLSNHPSIYASIDLSVPPSIHLSNHPSIYASIYLSVLPSLHPSIHPSVQSYIHYRSTNQVLFIKITTADIKLDNCLYKPTIGTRQVL